MTEERISFYLEAENAMEKQHLAYNLRRRRREKSCTLNAYCAAATHALRLKTATRKRKPLYYGEKPSFCRRKRYRMLYLLEACLL